MDECLGQRRQVVNQSLVAIGKCLVVAAVTLLEKRVEGLAVFDGDNTLRDEMQTKHRLHACMSRGGNVMLQQKGLHGIETGIIQAVTAAL